MYRAAIDRRRTFMIDKLYTLVVKEVRAAFYLSLSLSLARSRSLFLKSEFVRVRSLALTKRRRFCTAARAKR